MSVTPVLPLEPFRRYIEDKKAAYAREFGLEADQAMEQWAPTQPISDRRLRRWLRNPEGTVPYDTVDRVAGTDAREIYNNVVLALANPDPYRKDAFFCKQCGNELRVKAELCGFCIEENELERMAA